MSEEKINIVLLDHQQLFREGVRRVLESEDTFHIVVSSDHYSVVPKILSGEAIDVMLIDIHIFLENKKRVKEDIMNHTDIKIIVMSTGAKEYYVRDTIQLGVHGYLLKEMDVFSFVDAIKTVKSGFSYIHPAVTHDLVEDYRELSRIGVSEADEKVQRPLHLYTKRECEVLQLLTNGLSNRHIAETLNISEKTVKNHVSSLFKKMNVNDRTQAVVTAIRNNWVEI